MTARARMAPTTAAEERSGGFLEAGRGDWAGMKVHTGWAWVFSHRGSYGYWFLLASGNSSLFPFWASREKMGVEAVQSTPKGAQTPITDANYTMSC